MYICEAGEWRYSNTSLLPTGRSQLEHEGCSDERSFSLREKDRKRGYEPMLGEGKGV